MCVCLYVLIAKSHVVNLYTQYIGLRVIMFNLYNFRWPTQMTFFIAAAKEVMFYFGWLVSQLAELSE